jgi:myo-inositol-1(or 4)-monophosphatase
MANRSAVINVMAKAADKAARSLKRDFGEVANLQVSTKGPGDFVSVADHKSERTIREELQKARPNFGFMMEESGAIPGTDPDHTWIVDPLDGTTNFLHGLPHFSISIALQAKDEIVAALVLDPLRDETFWAEKGAGAFCNDRRMRVSSRRHLPESLLFTGIPFIGHGDRPKFVRQLDAAMRETAGVRRLGSAALDLAYVASGRCEGFWEEELSSWDIAAGILLVKESGGYVSDLKGGQTMLQSGAILATNGTLHAPLQALIGNA